MPPGIATELLDHVRHRAMRRWGSHGRRLPAVGSAILGPVSTSRSPSTPDRGSLGAPSIVEGKIDRALEALGPLAGRDVVVVGGGPRRARGSLAVAGAR